MSTPYVGEIRMFGFARVPQGWQRCDGSLLPIAENEVLFQLIGTTYGGDGQTTFAVPNLSGRVPMHFGSGQNLTTRTIGETGGVEGVTLSATQLPSHSHPMFATTVAANDTAIGQTVQFGSLSGGTMYATDVTGLTPRLTDPRSTGPAGTAAPLPHENLMPTLTVQFCMALVGIYPPHS